jgi:hypothetical protein
MAGAAITAAAMRGSCTNTAGARAPPPDSFTLRQAHSSGYAAQWPAARVVSGTPPIATSAVKPPAEKPNMPIRAGSIRSRRGHDASM